MDDLKLAGIAKQYEQTETTFTKKGMWPERFHNEVTVLQIASNMGVSTPRIVASELNELGGRIVYERLYHQRLDQVLWGKPDPELFVSVGHTLAEINAISTDREVSLGLPTRRFQDLERDILSRSILPQRIVSFCSKVFELACTKMLAHDAKLIHGDYTIQNIFYSDPLIVFDWEHSCSGSPVYDMGILLSFMVLLALDGGWSFTEYFLAMQYALDGYCQKSALERNDPLIHTFRFLGHRQIPQYYLLALEYLAVAEENRVARAILGGTVPLMEAQKRLLECDITMDAIWLNKLTQALQIGKYQIEDPFWIWCRKEHLI